jgi:hypothetical protein
LHPWLAGKISPAPEKSGDISALMYELRISFGRNTKDLQQGIQATSVHSLLEWSAL